MKGVTRSRQSKRDSQPNRQKKKKEKQGTLLSTKGSVPDLGQMWSCAS
jgi:hypothetical protein